MRYPFDGTFKQTQDWNDPRYRASYSQFGLLGHNGEDYALPEETQVVAPHDGIIKEAQFDSGYGNYVKIENEAEGSVLAHLSETRVEVGEKVTEGEVIGYSGNTGNSTGPHLHWGYYRTKTRDRDNGFLGYIDQTDWLDSAIIAQTDQTIIDLGKYGKHEIQAIRGFYADALNWQKDLENTRQALKECRGSPHNPYNSSDLSIKDLLILLIQKIFK